MIFFSVERSCACFVPDFWVLEIAIVFWVWWIHLIVIFVLQFVYFHQTYRFRLRENIYLPICGEKCFPSALLFRKSHVKMCRWIFKISFFCIVTSHNITLKTLTTLFYDDKSLLHLWRSLFWSLKLLLSTANWISRQYCGENLFS